MVPRPGALRRRVRGGGDRRAPAARGGAHRRRGLARRTCSRPSPPARWRPPRPQQATSGGEQPAVRRDLRRAVAGDAARRRGRARARSSPTDPELAAAVTAALEARGVACTAIADGDVAAGFGGAADALASTVARAVRSTRSSSPWPEPAPRPASTSDWERVLAEHAGIVDGIHADAGWARAVADHAAAADRPVRLVTLTDATTAGGRSRAQASAQLARAARRATGRSRRGLRRQRGGRRRRGLGRASSPPTCVGSPDGPGARRRRAGRRPRLARAAQPPAPERQRHLRRARRSRLVRRRAAQHRRRGGPMTDPSGADRGCPRAPVGPGPHRLVPVPRRADGARHGRRHGDGPPLRPCRPTGRRRRAGTSRSW